MQTINYTTKRGVAKWFRWPRQYFIIWQIFLLSTDQNPGVAIVWSGAEARRYSNGHQLTSDADGCAAALDLFNNYSSLTPIILFIFKCR